MRTSSSEGNIDLNITARFCRVHCNHNSVNVELHSGPLGITQHDNCNPTARQVLLVLDVLVGREQDIESGFFRRREQIAVG